jgi:Fic family protein
MGYTPKFHVTAHLLKIIEEISAMREKILAATIQVPWIPRLQREARTRTAHSSTAIEGNPLTLEEVRALAEGQPVPQAGERARREILNQLAALRWIEERSQKKTMTRADLLRLHTVIAADVMDQGRPGLYRTFGVRVGSYVPPMAETVPSLMRELLAWWNRHAREWSPVISSAILHFRIEDIHPFGDGNGRMGRTIALWELYRRGFDTHHIFSVDEVYWEHRSRYYAQLDAVRTAHGDLTGWLEYAAEVLHLTLERVVARAQRLAIQSRTEKIHLTPQQEVVLGLLRDHGALAPREIWQALGMTKQGAHKILRPLLTAGLIQRHGTRKSGRYVIG